MAKQSKPRDAGVEVRRRHGQRYRKLEVAVWGDDKFMQLSAPPPNGQTLWLYLLTGPRTTTFPGLVVARPAVMASDLRWDTEGFREGFREALSEVCAKGLIDIDEESGVVLLRKALFHGPGRAREDVRDTARPESPNVIVGWSKSWPEVPDCGLKQVYLQQLGAFCEALGEGFLKAFHVGFRKALVKASMEASIDPSPHPSRNQDQDQDQDQDQISLSRARAIITAQPPSDPELERRQSLRKQIWGKLDALRREIASELGEDIQPLLAFDPGEAALAMRIVEAGDQASARCEHVLAVLAAEARGKQTVQFLTGAVFEPPSWRRLLGMSVKDIEKSLSRAGPRSAPPEQPRRIKTL